MRMLLMIPLFAVANVAMAEEKIPQDVRAYIRNAEACEHFAGEFDSDLSEARQKEIARSAEKYCPRAQKQLGKLQVRYKNDARVSNIIRHHTNESVTSFR